MIGKNFLITGAASGLGRETALQLSKTGANLVLVDLNKVGLEKTKNICKTEENKIILIDVDITNFELLIEKLNTMCEPHSITGFVHCAGIPCISPVKTLSYELYLKVMQVNTFSALEITKWFSNKKNHSAENPSIVFISSVYGLVGSAANTGYAMSKGAIQAMTKSLSMELAPKGIRVNCVAPGFMHTKMEEKTNKYFDQEHENILNNLHPLGLGEAKDVASMIVFLLSDASKWTTGAIMNVDGGFTAQ